MYLEGNGLVQQIIKDGAITYGLTRTLLHNQKYSD